MNSPKVAAALNTISLAFAELAEAIDSPEPVSPGKPGAAVDSPPTAAPADSSMPEFPPLESWGDEEDLLTGGISGAPVGKVSERDYVLGRCSVHDKPWTVKEGGVSKNGRPYKAFWKCNGKNPDDSFCNKKPDASWVKTHDPEAELVGA